MKDSWFRRISTLDYWIDLLERRYIDYNLKFKKLLVLIEDIKYKEYTAYIMLDAIHMTKKPTLWKLKVTFSNTLISTSIEPQRYIPYTNDKVILVDSIGMAKLQPTLISELNQLYL